MKALLICPSDRAPLAEVFPGGTLTGLPLFGQTLLEYWLSHLAARGFKHICVLVHHDPAAVLAITGTGTRWGLEVDVVPESRELSPAQALLKYGEELGTATISNHIFTLDHFPGRPELPLFAGSAAFFQGLRAWLPEALTPDRVGFRQYSPGIFVGRKASIARTATLRPPCWIGSRVWIGPNAVLEPYSIIEDCSMVEASASIESSYIGPDTLVGRFTEIRGALVYGNRLADWRSGRVITVPESFVLAALRSPATGHRESWLSRAVDLCSRKGEALVAWKHMVIKKEG